MKKTTLNFIMYLFNQELDQEYYNDFLDQKELDQYTIDLIDAAKDFIDSYGDWFDKYFLDEKLEKYNVK